MSQQNLSQTLVLPREERRATSDSPTARALRRFRHHRLAMIGLVIIVVLVIAALLGSEEAALSPDLRARNLPPSLEHPFGTDRTGRDVFARTLVGGRVSLSVGLVAVLCSLVVGTVLGAIAGYYQGLVDNVIMRLVDIVMCFPLIVLLLSVVAILGPGIYKIMIIIGLLTWPTPCRIVRGQFLSLRQKEYVEAARCIGMTDLQVAWRHILPNAMAPLLVYASLGVATAVLLEAGLSYLGLGVQPPTPSWGNMLNTARSISTMEQTPWQWIPPGICTVLFVLAVNFVGDGIRDAIDPRAVEGK
ncbi:MAG: ABC transporter permease [Chloroflexi bacterium OHK40]